MSPGIKLGTLHTEGHVLANCVTLAPSIIFGNCFYFPISCREEESGDEISTIGSSRATDKDQSALPSPLQLSVATQTDSSIAETPSSPETSTALPSLQPVPYVKNALRASKFNRLGEQACLSKEITLVVGTKVVCSLDFLIQLFAESVVSLVVS